jgi:chromosome segregation ATPase
VFSFGAVLHELLTGRALVEGNTPDEWKASLARRESKSANGSQSEIGRLLDRCLKRRPEERWQNVSVVVVELKLLTASQRHAKAAADWRHWLSSVQEDLEQVGGRLAAHQSEHEAAVTELQRAIGQVATKTKEHAVSVAAAAETLGTLGETVTVATQKLGTLNDSVTAAHEKLGTLGKTVTVAGQKLGTLNDSVTAAHEKLGTLGETVTVAGQKLGTLNDSVTTAHEKLGTLGESVKDLTGKTEIHGRTIESLQSAVTQTDEVIDHVVDAFDSMHRLVLERAETGTAVASQRSS